VIKGSLRETVAITREMIIGMNIAAPEKSALAMKEVTRLLPPPVSSNIPRKSWP
jgi:hypothetical protein